MKWITSPTQKSRSLLVEEEDLETFKYLKPRSRVTIYLHFKDLTKGLPFNRSEFRNLFLLTDKDDKRATKTIDGEKYINLLNESNFEYYEIEDGVEIINVRSIPATKVLVLPKTIKEIKPEMFIQYYQQITDLYFNGTLEDWCKINMTTYNGFASINNLYFLDPNGSVIFNKKHYTKVVDLEIPENIKIINENVFYGIHSIQSIVFHGKDKIIKENAFSYCGNLQKVFIDEETKICSFAFNGCSYIKTMIISKNCKINTDFFSGGCWDTEDPGYIYFGDNTEFISGNYWIVRYNKNIIFEKNIIHNFKDAQIGTRFSNYNNIYINSKLSGKDKREFRSIIQNEACRDYDTGKNIVGKIYEINMDGENPEDLIENIKILEHVIEINKEEKHD